MYNYNLYQTQSTNFYTFSLIAFIISLATAIIVYFVFMDKRNVKNYSNTLKYIYNYLHFNHFLIEPILKITYLFFTVYITISALGFIGTSLVATLSILIFGNLFLRLVYEGIMIFYKIYIHVSEINKKMK